jgi:hypothetical protein
MSDKYNVCNIKDMPRHERTNVMKQDAMYNKYEIFNTKDVP